MESTRIQPDKMKDLDQAVTEAFDAVHLLHAILPDSHLLVMIAIQPSGDVDDKWTITRS